MRHLLIKFLFFNAYIYYMRIYASTKFNAVQKCVHKFSWENNSINRYVFLFFAKDIIDYTWEIRGIKLSDLSDDRLDSPLSSNSTDVTKKRRRERESEKDRMRTRETEKME